MSEKIEVSEEVLLDGLESLKYVVDIQLSDGHWNYDPYMHGMANGLILALSLFSNDQPEFLNRPDKWVVDNEVTEVCEKDFDGRC